MTLAFEKRAAKKEVIVLIEFYVTQTDNFIGIKWTPSTSEQILWAKFGPFLSVRQLVSAQTILLLVFVFSRLGGASFFWLIELENLNDFWTVL